MIRDPDRDPDSSEMASAPTGSNVSDQSDNSRTTSKEVTAFEPPRFVISSSSQEGDSKRCPRAGQIDEMLQYLETHGYCVIANACVDEVIAAQRERFWDFCERINPDLRRNDPSTWDNRNWLPKRETGILNSYGFNHSEFSWQTRLLPCVRDAFAAIWGTPDLIVSYDAGNAFRPNKRRPDWKTKQQWWHVDQSPVIHPGRCSFQGFVTYYDSTAETGGLCLYPGSHKHHEELSRHADPKLASILDFVDIDIAQSRLASQSPILVCAKAGDLIVWDSRTVHCNTHRLTPDDPNTSSLPDSEDDEIIRLVSYVCMLPRKAANTTTLIHRRKAFLHSTPSSHWPDKMSTHHDEQQRRDLRKCSKEQLKLVGYQDWECVLVRTFGWPLC